MSDNSGVARCDDERTLKIMRSVAKMAEQTENGMIVNLEDGRFMYVSVVGGGES